MIYFSYFNINRYFQFLIATFFLWFSLLCTSMYSSFFSFSPRFSAWFLLLFHFRLEILLPAGPLCAFHEYIHYAFLSLYTQPAHPFLLLHLMLSPLPLIPSSKSHCHTSFLLLSQTFQIFWYFSTLVHWRCLRLRSNSFHSIQLDILCKKTSNHFIPKNH